jgi:hypothetical protein
MNLNVRKPLRHMSQMQVEPFVSILILPARIDLFDGITKDGAEPVLYPHRVAELFFDCIDASL